MPSSPIYPEYLPRCRYPYRILHSRYQDGLRVWLTAQSLGEQLTVSFVLNSWSYPETIQHLLRRAVHDLEANLDRLPFRLALAEQTQLLQRMQQTESF